MSDQIAIGIVGSLIAAAIGNYLLTPILKGYVKRYSRRMLELDVMYKASQTNKHDQLQFSLLLLGIENRSLWSGRFAAFNTFLVIVCLWSMYSLPFVHANIWEKLGFTAGAVLSAADWVQNRISSTAAEAFLARIQDRLVSAAAKNPVPVDDKNQ
jgi:hypothetical protein